MTEFTGKAFPTEYRGRRYRSRLEARWAAFFDRLAWKHEYEPVDLGAWSPDFLLRDLNVVVEIKPITSIDAATAKKMVKACEESGALEKFRWIVLLGVAPCSFGASTMIGWKYDKEDGWRHALLEWWSGWRAPIWYADIVDRQKEGFLTALGNAGVYDQMHNPPPRPFHHHTMELWSDASNDVQWKRP